MRTQRPLRKALLTSLLLLLTQALCLKVSAKADPDDDDGEANENPVDRALFRSRQMLDETGKWNPGKLLKAKEDVKAMTFRASSWSLGPTVSSSSSNQVGILSAGIQPAGWEALGPGNVGGRIRSILIHPTSPDILYVGAVSGGVWKSVNRGASWFPLQDFMTSLIVSCLAMDPSNPNTLYAGTGEGIATTNQGDWMGAGVFKSTDGGATWNQLSATATTSSDWWTVNRLAVSPANGNILLAATNAALLRSADGGVTWSKRLSSRVKQVLFHPTDGNLAIAGGGGGLTPPTLYSLDGGLTWTASSGLPASCPRFELAYARSNPSLVYASADNNGGELYLSRDGGKTFDLRSTGTNVFMGASDQGIYDNALWVDPLNPDHLLWGGVSFMRSLDGGVSWTFLSGIHSDHHVIVQAQDFSSTNPTVYIGNDGGIWRAVDYTTVGSTTGFENLNHSLAITQFYGGAGNATLGFLLGGTQDNGTPVSEGQPDGWVLRGFGDGGFVGADPVPDANGNYFFYGENQYWSTFRLTYSTSTHTWQNAISLNGTSGSGFDFIPPMILDPNNARRLYKGDGGLQKLENAGVADGSTPWQRVKQPGPISVSAIAVAPGNSDIVWVGDMNGNIFSTANALAASPTWTQRNTGTSLPGRYCSRIAFDPANIAHVYLTFTGFTGGNVWKSLDGGATWTGIHSNLPAMPMRSILVNPSNSNYLYVGSELGVFASENGGTSWSPSSDGPNNAPVDELFWQGNVLVAATHGRGMFRIRLNSPPTVTLTSPQNNATFAAGSTLSLAATASDPDGSVARIEYFQGTTKLGEGASFSWTSVPKGTYTLTAKATDNDGGSAISAPVTVTVVEGTLTRRNPTADAYVRDGTSAALNFGTATTLEVKTGSAGANRDSYFKFDLASLSDFSKLAKLRVYASLSTSGSVTMSACPVSSTSWTETGITWNTKPALGSALGSVAVTSTAKAWYELDVTKAVRDARAGGKTAISLALHDPASVTPAISASSREASSNKPELMLNQVPRSALLVVGNVTLGTGDAALNNRLKAMGFTVTIKDGTSSATSDATGKALIVISSTVTSTTVNTKFRTVATPVVNCDQLLQDDFAMTGLVSGTDYGTASSQTQVNIVTSSHALAGGLTGTQTVLSAAGTFNWGKPGANAVKIAALVSDATRIADYGYEKGASMVGLTAPARRVHLFLGDTAPASLSSAGWKLFDVAVVWAAGL
jgi:hypothetical protein